MARWLLTLVVAFALAPPVRAAPPPGSTRSEVIRGEEDADERPLDDEVRLIEARLTDVRERVFRSKARVAALQELVVGDAVAAGARTVVRHRNEMGAAFVLESLTYALDGAPVFTEANAGGDLERKAQIDVFSGRLAPGHHVVGVQLVYRADDGGEPRRVRVESSHAFDVQAGKVTTIEAAGHEQKAAKLEDRPAVRWNVEAGAEKAAPQGGAGGGRR